MKPGALTSVFVLGLLAAAAVRADVPDGIPLGARDMDIAARYEAEVARNNGHDEIFSVPVIPVGDELRLSYDAAAGRLHVLYRMDANQVTEGWSWRPEAKPDEADYYRYKFLPLGRREVQQGAVYTHEDLPGRPRQVRPVWRYHYYFAFDNPYEFYTRPTVEDDTGFAADLSLPPDRARQLMEPGRVRLLARGHWTPPFHAESSTFWKATDGRPEDVTMKNRYFIGRLEEVLFVDGATGDVLARFHR
jgi:hypothetical protein